MKGRAVSLMVAVALLAVAGVAFAASPSSIDLTGSWKFQTDPTNIGVEKGWQSPGFVDRSWKTLRVPGEWEKQGITEVNPHWQMDDLNQPYSGYSWYRRVVTIPADWKGRSLVLDMGRIDDQDWTYLNGKLVGKTAETDKACSGMHRSYNVPGDAVKFGQANVIAVRVLDVRGVGGIVEGPVSIESDASSGDTVETHGGANDRVSATGDVVVGKGQSVRDAVAVMGNVTVEGHVERDAVSVMGDVIIRPGGSVGRDAVSVGGQVIKETGGTVGRDTTSVAMGFSPDLLRRVCLRAKHFGVGWALLTLAMLLLQALVTAIVVALFPGRMASVAEASVTRPGWSLLYGFVGMLMIVPLAVLLLLTCIGIPFIFVELALAYCVWVAGGVAVRLAIGKKLGEGLNRPFRSAVLAAVVGSVLVSLVGLLKLVPYGEGLGAVAIFVLYLFGFGAVIMTGFGADPDWFAKRFGGNPPPAAPPAEGGEGS